MTLNPSSPDDIKVRCPVCKNRFSIEHHNECPYCEAKEQMQIYTVICGKCFYSYDKQIHITCPDCGSKDRLEQMPKLETFTTPCSDEYFVNQITTALKSDNKDQQDIAKVGLQLICKLLDKNADYGSSAFKSPCLTPGIPAGTAIEVRMSDKLERIFNLLKGNTPKVAESIEDTFDDLLGYLVLRKVTKQRAANGQ